MCVRVCLGGVFAHTEDTQYKLNLASGEPCLDRWAAPSPITQLLSHHTDNYINFGLHTHTLTCTRVRRHSHG